MLGEDALENIGSIGTEVQRAEKKEKVIQNYRNIPAPA